MPSSTRRLSDVARHVVYPATIRTTGFPAVKAQCEAMGLRFDAWQEGIGTLALGKDASGKYASTVSGVTLSIPRQTGKTFLVGAIVLALCTLNPHMTVIWTAHRTRTATKTFQGLAALAKRKKVAPHVAAIRATNGEQEIRFCNGSVIMFGAREQGFGRGFDAVDVVVFDEAQILTEKALEDIVPATNASKQPTGALLFFMGTPPRPIDPGEEFAARRKRALAGELTDGVYAEFSADPDASPDDIEQIGRANPSFPDRTPLESVQRMRANLTDDESFMREAMGIWAARSRQQVIEAGDWSRAADTSSTATDRIALGLDVSPDQSMASVSLAGQRADGRWHVELWEQRPGTAWVAAYLSDLLGRYGEVRALVVDERSPAASLVPDLEAAGLRVTMTRTADFTTACARFFAGIVEGSVIHTDQPQMNAALAAAAKRTVGEAWAWSRKSSASDITALVAATLALWGAERQKARAPKRSGSRKVVVLQ